MALIELELTGIRSIVKLVCAQVAQFSDSAQERDMDFCTTRRTACAALAAFTATCAAVMLQIFAATGASGVDLVVTKSAPPSVLAGLPVTFTITLRNDGNVTATNIVLTDPLPSGVLFGQTSASCVAVGPCLTEPLQYSPDFTMLTVTVAAVGPKTNVTVKTTMTTTRPMSLTNFVYVTSSTPDDMPSNNVASATVSVTGNLVYAPIAPRAPVTP